MVPHHNNAVNMAKILLKMDVLDPEDEDDAGMIDMLWAIINAQNYQNHNMEAYLDAKGLPAIGEAQCSGDSAMWHKNGETASAKGCEWVAMFPEKRRRPCGNQPVSQMDATIRFPHRLPRQGLHGHGPGGRRGHGLPRREVHGLRRVYDDVREPDGLRRHRRRRQEAVWRRPQVDAVPSPPPAAGAARSTPLSHVSPLACT